MHVGTPWRHNAKFLEFFGRNHPGIGPLRPLGCMFETCIPGNFRQETPKPVCFRRYADKGDADAPAEGGAGCKSHGCGTMVQLFLQQETYTCHASFVLLDQATTSQCQGCSSDCIAMSPWPPHRANLELNLDLDWSIRAGCILTLPTGQNVVTQPCELST